MKKFLDEDFLLETPTASLLFNKYAKGMSVFDYHNHLSAKEIYEDKPLGNLANAWLDHDHYKWRAMRAFGISEDIITSHIDKEGNVKTDEERGGKEVVDKADYERYLAFVKTIQGCAGNPLYHWTHLELQRYFGIKEPLTLKNADKVWAKCNNLLSKKEYSPRGLLLQMKVKQLCTTDDPCDSLEYHKKLNEEWKDCIVRPSFRPDNIINIKSRDFVAYIRKLEKVSCIAIKDLRSLTLALQERLAYFIKNGCVVSDHSLENDFYAPLDLLRSEVIFSKALSGKGENLTEEEIRTYQTCILTILGKLYSCNKVVMQLHIGALRDNNSFLYETKGKNIGMDSLQDFSYASQLGGLLDNIYARNDVDDFIFHIISLHDAESTPKVIVYNLNPKDNEAVASMTINFRNCIFGPAWWFNDHKVGIEEQLKVYSRTGVLGKNIGMLTDSRSFLSYPRHEYYRRILCNYIGNLVEKGEYPFDEEYLGQMVQNICYNNAVEFFGKSEGRTI